MEHEDHLGKVPENDNHFLSSEEIQASFQAAYTLGRLMHAESIQPEINAARNLYETAISEGATEQEIARLDRILKYWRHVQAEMDDIYRNSH